MDEQEIADVGGYCEILLGDEQFKKLIALCESNLSLQMLESGTAEEREKTHRTYLGFKELVEMMRGFVCVKDEILAKNEDK